VGNNKFYIFCDLEDLSNYDQDQFRSEDVEPIFFPTNDYLKLLNSPKTTGICMHNIYGYDLQVFEKLSGITYDWDSINNRKVKIIDSLVMSRVLWPDRPVVKGTKSQHGLEAFGIRTGIAKPKVEDWSDQSLEVYINRVIEDVKINKATYFMLLKETRDVAFSNGAKKGSWTEALQMGMKSAYLMSKQEKDGAVFAVDDAKRLIHSIDQQMKEIAEDVEPKLGERALPKAKQPNFPSQPWKKPFDFKSPFKAKGGLKKPVNEYLKTTGIPAHQREDYICSMLEKEVVDGHTLIHNYIEDELPKHPTLLSQASINYCLKFGINELQEQFKEIKTIWGLKIQGYSPDEERKLTEPMRLANQNDIKNFFISELGWKPQLWRTKNLLVDLKTKQNFPKDEQEKKIQKYIKDIQESPYKSLVLKELGYKKDPDFKSKAFYNRVKRNGRAVPSSPQLKNIRGDLCPSLEKLDAGMAKKIVLWLSLRNRRTTIKSFDKNTGWLNHRRLQVDGRLPGASTGLTNTRRQKHHIICNIPAASDSVVLGKEVRDLFISPKNYCCVGADASGIEGRAMAEAAWNFDNGAYAEIILNGDVHNENAKSFSKAIGREVGRGEGKSPFYAGIYGCQAKKQATLLGVEERLGDAINKALWEVAWGLEKCKNALGVYWENTGKKYIMAIDGSKIFTRSKHSLLNAYLQSADSILMDWACCWIHDKIKEEKLDAQRWIYYHDEINHYHNLKEVQYELFPLDKKPEEYRDKIQYSKPKLFREGEILHFGLPKGEDPLPTDQWIQHYSRVGEICVEGIKNAGKHYGFRVPLDGQYILGGSWGKTH